MSLVGGVVLEDRVVARARDFVSIFALAVNDDRNECCAHGEQREIDGQFAIRTISTALFTYSDQVEFR